MLEFGNSGFEFRFQSEKYCIKKTFVVIISLSVLNLFAEVICFFFLFSGKRHILKLNSQKNLYQAKYIVDQNDYFIQNI